MTGRAGRKTDATGRSSTKHKDAKSLRDVGQQFIMQPRSLRESPSWRFLSWQARKALDRLELEHLAHGGQKNGQLGVSYAQFIAAGVSDNCIPRALVELFAAGLVERTSKGGKAVGDYRPTSTYRITYLMSGGYITHEWFDLKTIEQVEERFDRMWKEWRAESASRQKRAGKSVQDEPHPIEALKRMAS